MTGPSYHILPLYKNHQQMTFKFLDELFFNTTSVFILCRKNCLRSRLNQLRSASLPEEQTSNRIISINQLTGRFNQFASPRRDPSGLASSERIDQTVNKTNYVLFLPVVCFSIALVQKGITHLAGGITEAICVPQLNE